MSRRSPARPGRERQTRQGSAGEVTVSRIEQHHVDAFEAVGGEWPARARALLDERLAGTGFGLAAVRDDSPVGLVGVHTDQDGWRLHHLAVVADAAGQDVEGRLVAAVEELARPLGSLQADLGDDAARRVLEQLGWTAAASGHAKQLG